MDLYSYCYIFTFLDSWKSWFLGVQTPNCIRQTAYDAVGLDYQPVTVIVDATAAATPEIHFGKHLSIFLKDASGWVGLTQ